MELIPVFAFIVLVASIVTFIFSIAAYVLYKIREKRGRFASTTHPAAFKAELVSPNYYYLPNNEVDNGYANNLTKEQPHIQNRRSNENFSEETNIIDKNNGNELVWR